MVDIELLIRTVMQCSKNIRRHLGPGFLEAYQVEMPINVYYEGVPVGEFKADIVVENELILELKAVNSLHMAHEVQLVNYLTATGIDNGLLINFGSEELQFRRKFRIYRKRLS